MRLAKVLTTSALLKPHVTILRDTMVSRKSNALRLVELFERRTVSDRGASRHVLSQFFPACSAKSTMMAKVLNNSIYTCLQC